MSRITLPLLFALVLLGCRNDIDKLGPRAFRVDSTVVAIDGYSPVSYFQRGAAERGHPAFAVEHDGVRYFLTDSSQVMLFQADPAAYEPAHGGWCTYMLSGSGRLVRANPEAFRIVDDELLLFFKEDVDGFHVDGLENWLNAEGEESDRIEMADDQWSGIQSGDRRAVLFDL